VRSGAPARGNRVTTPAAAGAKLANAPLPTPAAEPSVMGMPRATDDWTATRVQALPDDGMRHELIDGELVVTPAPAWSHQRAVLALYRQLHACVAGGIGDVMVAPADIILDQRTLVEPDLFVVPLVNGRRPRDWASVGELLLVVEVLSPATARYDRQLKRLRYQREGVPEYWIVDVASRLVERWCPEDTRPEIITGALSWQPLATGPECVVDLDSVFHESEG
jgi:Uma2 family endonuclease